MNIVHAWLQSQLHPRQAELREGIVARFQVIPFLSGEDDQQRLMLLVHDFCVLGESATLKCGRRKLREIAVPAAVVAPAAEAHRWGALQPGSDAEKPDTAECNGTLCNAAAQQHGFGVVFRDCCMFLSPPPAYDSVAVTSIFPGIDQHYCADMTSMPQNLRRNLLYFWITTQVFQLSGRHKRSELPACVLAYVRALHPNARGEPYTGFQPSAAAAQE